MTSRELWTLEHGDTGAALLAHVHAFDFFSRTLEACDHMHYYCECGASEPCWDETKAKAESASVAHSDRDKSEQPTAKPAVDPRVKRLVALSRWERAGMLAYIAATFPDAFDEAYNALGLGES